jgi:hypothetical protein
VSQAFGTHFAIKNILFSSAPDGKTGTLLASLDSGFLQVSWPDPTIITASVDMSDHGAESGYPVPGVTAPPKTAQQAQGIAIAYAKQHYPWAVRGSQVHATAVGLKGSLGWLVSWRRYHERVLMPMRLDVQVDRAGRISQLSARQVDDQTLPKTTLPKSTAASTALASMPTCMKAEPGELMATRLRGTWLAVWRVIVTCETSGAIVNVNAVSGKIESSTSSLASPASPR